jgi:hypothetical protein
MRHLIVQPADDGVQVMEGIAISNQATARGSAKNRRRWQAHVFHCATARDATKVQLAGGFHEMLHQGPENGRIANTMPLVPGVTQYQFFLRSAGCQERKARTSRKHSRCR